MQEIQPLKLLSSYEQRKQIIESAIWQKATTGMPLQILEAGCGQKWQMSLQGVDYSLTGVDLDGAALAIRKKEFNDLDEMIEGDLRIVDLPAGSFDVIYNSYVLEHVDGAAAVLNNFVMWLKPDGIIILKIPDPNSVKGFFTRVTPHGFHVLYYRYFLGQKMAGQPGYTPYRTYFDPVVSRSGMSDFCQNSGLEIVAEYGDGLHKPGKGPAKWLYQLFIKTISMLSLGSLSARHSDLLYVLRLKPAK